MKKRILSLLMTVVMLMTLVPMSTFTSAAATTTKTIDQAMDWLAHVKGKKVGSGQCVALVKAYYEYLGAPTPYGNGCDYATNKLPKNWKRIKGATPEKGDILVWTNGYKNYGHVAICAGKGKYYHQNWNGKFVRVLTKSYTGGYNHTVDDKTYRTNYWGVIRPDYKIADSTPSIYETITEGRYYIRNKASNNYLNVSGGKDKNKTVINTIAFNGSDAQVYKITRISDEYRLMPACSTTRVVNPYCDKVESGKKVNLYSRTYDGSQWWYFKAVGDGYAIINSKNTNVCLTPTTSGMKVSTYTGADNQIWYLEELCKISYNANGGENAPAYHRVKEGNTAVLSTQQPTRSCYEFKGWATTKDATVALFKPGQEFTINDSMTLYAVWSCTGHKYSDDCDKTCNVCKESRSTAHKYVTTTVKATTSANGKVVKKCSVCGYVAKTTTVYRVKSVKLSSSVYTYNGKVKAPSVIVKDSKDNKLEKNVDYKVTYAPGRKLPGKYSVIVTFIGEYSGTVNLTITIKPATPKITKLTTTKGKASFTWANVTGESGYEVYYSTKKSSGFKKVSSYEADKTNGTKSKLTSGKTYYFKVRAYKTVDDAKIYSSWSTVKSVKIK